MSDVKQDQTVPVSGLGQNFEKPVLPLMAMATKARVWGDATPNAIEPNPEQLTAEMRATITRQAQGQCYFCGVRARAGHVHNINHNHQDLRPENLRLVDPLCHGWQHLGEIDDGDAFIAYLPGLSPQDTNHLQRATMIALETGDEQTKADARKILNWMASHREYTEKAWGTHSPKIFAEAMTRLGKVDADVNSLVFQGLSVIFNPAQFSQVVKGWAQDAYGAAPTSTWAKIHHEVMNAPS